MAPNYSSRSSSSYEWDLLFHLEIEDPETRWQNYGYRFYLPELGKWPSRDQIAEEGGVNLYSFVSNDPTNKTDNLGLWATAITFGAAVACAIPNAIFAAIEYPEEEMRHCVASCWMARSCGKQVSLTAMSAFEIVLYPTRGRKIGTDDLGFDIASLYDPDKINYDELENMIKDDKHNKIGVACAGFETWIPLLGNITRWAREDCHCCCERRIHGKPKTPPPPSPDQLRVIRKDNALSNGLTER